MRKQKHYKIEITESSAGGWIGEVFGEGRKRILLSGPPIPQKESVREQCVRFVERLDNLATFSVTEHYSQAPS